MKDSTEVLTPAEHLKQCYSKVLAKNVVADFVEETPSKPAHVVCEVRLTMSHKNKRHGGESVLVHAFAYELPLSEFWELAVGGQTPVAVLNWKNPSNRYPDE